MQAPDDAVRAALAKILESESFAHSPRHREFLQYIVDETLAGRGDRLRGYTIAVDVFQRSADFDALNDPYVRVEAGRLRRRLAEYYLQEGAADPVRITLNKGSYLPVFETSEPEAPTATDSAAPAAPVGAHSRSGFPALVTAAVVIALICVLVIYVLRPGSRSQPEDASRFTGFSPTVYVESLENLGDPGFDFFASGLTEKTLVLLNQYRPIWGTIHVFRRDNSSSLDLSVPFQYLVQGSVLARDGGLRVTARIVDPASGVLLWTFGSNDSLSAQSAFAIQDRIAAEIANVIRDPYGPISNAQASIVAESPPQELAASDCHLLYALATSSMSRPGHRATKTCLERFAASSELSAAGWGLLGIVRYREFEDGDDLRDGTVSAIQSAYDAVQRALDLDGSQPLPHGAFALVNIGRGLPDRSTESVERLLGLNPPPSIRVQGEGLLLRLGAPHASIERFEEALAGAYQVSPYVYTGPALHYLRAGDEAAALRWAERIDAPDFTLAQVLQAALAARGGDLERARRHVRRILALHPAFETYGRNLVNRWSDDPRVTDGLLDGLRRAGLAVR